MATFAEESGTQTATISTEHVLNGTSPNTVDGVYSFWVSTENMVAGDTLELRIKEKVISGGTQLLVSIATISGVQADKAWTSPSLILFHGWDFTLKQTAGTGRNFPWSIRKIA